ncbi:hypothetical protein NQ317_000028 [Molorchus minor]|uniref:RNase H type-1 domain-containing protein n=1 Tax=Molorchus minor TaxID=1323400 RepID=A0ABQ9JWW7_9CUCU|nr:hypothetical protein NQ317_000028 [Molorchus minor]
MIPTIPRTNIIHPIIIRAYGNTSPLKDAIDALLTLNDLAFQWDVISMRSAIDHSQCFYFMASSSVFWNLQVVRCICKSEANFWRDSGYMLNIDVYRDNRGQLRFSKDRVEPNISPSQTLRIQIPNRQFWDDEKQVICQNGIVWFTDGSKIGDMAGAGVYGKTTGTELVFALGSYATVFQAEVYAILACGLENLKRAPKGKIIQICSDSRAALLAIESSKVKSRLVLEYKKTLNDLASRNKVILTWVPEHSGVRENEEADRLAREGSAMYPNGPEPILGVPYSMGSRP